jgi:hypothetical protein
MATGRLDKVQMLSKLYDLKNELHDEKTMVEHKGLANKYLDKVLDYLKEFRQ